MSMLVTSGGPWLLPPRSHTPHSACSLRGLSLCPEMGVLEVVISGGKKHMGTSLDLLRKAS